MLTTTTTMIDRLLHAHLDIEAAGLVVASQGNISVRDHATMLIKASGIPYDQLTPDHMIRIRLSDGENLGKHKPSTDFHTHHCLYHHFDNLNAIVHTHSVYATAFAAQGLSIPCALTEIADVFGGRVRCLPYCDIGDESIGRAIAKEYNDYPRAVLIARHGVFALGASLGQAIQNAILVEHAAKVLAISRSIWGKLPSELSEHQIIKNHERYQEYGQ